jgi:hypothetical protein
LDKEGSGREDVDADATAAAVQDSGTPQASTPLALTSADLAAMTTSTEGTPGGHMPVFSKVPVVVLNEVLSSPMVVDKMGVRKRTRANMGDGEDSPPTPTGSPDKAVHKKPARGPSVGPSLRSRKGSM